MTKIIYIKNAEWTEEDLIGFDGVNPNSGKSASFLRDRKLKVLVKRRWQDFDCVVVHRFIKESVKSLFESYDVEGEYYPVATDFEISPFLFVPLAVRSVIDPEQSKLNKEHFLSKYSNTLYVIAAIFQHIDNEPPLYLDLRSNLILVRDDLAQEIESRQFSGIELVGEGVDNRGLKHW